MSKLFSKNENLQRSAPIIGYEILKLLKKSSEGKVSIFDIAAQLEKKIALTPQNIYYGMIFLYTLDIIDFKAPYLVLK